MVDLRRSASPTLGDPDHDLRRATVRGARVGVGAQAAGAALQLVGVVVLARMLTPSEYGVVAMAAVALGVGEVVRDLGLSSAVVQAPSVSTQQRTNVFWLTVGNGGVLAVLAYAAADPLARFFEEPGVAPVMQALAAVFVLSGAETMYRAELVRTLRFSRLAAVDVTGLAAGAGCAVLLAASGAGVWALVAQQLVRSCCALTMMVAVSGWAPGRPRGGSGLAPLLRFGLNVTAVQLLTYASRNVDSLVIGYRFGPAALGVYGRAFQLVAFPLGRLQTPSMTVALPVLSRLHDRPREYATFVGRGQTLLLHGVCAMVAVACAQAHVIVPAVIGPQWVDAVPFFRVLVVGGAFAAAAFATDWVFLSKGLTASHLRFSVVTRSAMVLAVVAGSAGGLLGVAIAYSAALMGIWLLGLVWVRRVAGAPAGAMLSSAARPLVGHCLAGAASFSATTAVGSHTVTGFVAGLVTVGCVWGLLVALWPAFRRDAAFLLRTSRSALRRVS